MAVVMLLTASAHRQLLWRLTASAIHPSNKTLAKTNLETKPYSCPHCKTHKRQNKTLTQSCC